MTCILGLETGRGPCSAALYVDGTLNEDTHFPDGGETRQSNDQILGLIDGLFAAAEMRPWQLDAVAFDCGPGSFTGVRLAASVAQALALGADAQVVPVPSTFALAVGAARRLALPHSGEAEPARQASSSAKPDRRPEAGVPPHSGQGVVVSIRSRREAFYLASFAIDEGRPQPRQPDQLLDACPDWAAFSDGWPLVGDRPPWLPAEVAHFELTVGAGLIASLGATALAEGAGLPPELGLPTYVRGDTPWRPAA